MGTALISRDWVGRVVDGRFALQEWLGGAPTSGVYRTELLQGVPKKAAIKLIAAREQVADAYVAAWAKAKIITHPNLMQIFRYGRYQFGTIEFVYIVTEYADEVLSQIIPERALNVDEAREMLSPVVETLAFLHGKGMVYGHLKPSNIMVVENQLKLASDHVSTKIGPWKNARERTLYDAPEGLDEAPSQAADVWSLGVTMAESLTQRLPAWNRNGYSEPLLPDGMPAPFAEIAQGCLRANPLRRATLKEIEQRLDGSGTAEFSIGAADEKAPSRSRIVILILALIVVVATIAFFMKYGHRTQSATATRTDSGGATPEAQEHNSPDQPVAKGPSAKGEVLRRAMPSVTPDALATITGTITVMVRVTVDASGRVTEARLDSTGPSHYFSEHAVEAARGWKFKPPEKDGRQTASEWTLRFRFHEEGMDAVAFEGSAQTLEQ
jgi:TonB family protein